MTGPSLYQNGDTEDAQQHAAQDHDQGNAVRSFAEQVETLRQPGPAAFFTERHARRMSRTSTRRQSGIAIENTPFRFAAAPGGVLITGETVDEEVDPPDEEGVEDQQEGRKGR